jgi:FixJ family two-component response regulator
MPGINGYDLARRLKPEAPEMKVIIMTGHCQAEVSGYMETGLADGWLFKPFSAKDLGAILKKFGLPHAWRQAPPR